jgi:hypothetical protein
MDQLANLLATSASVFDSFQRQIEAEPEMAVTFAVQIEVSSLQQDGQVLGLLQLDQEHTVIDRVQDGRRHIDHVTLMHLDSVKHAEESVDVLAHDQRLEVVVMSCFRPQVDLSAVNDVPGLGFAVRLAEVLSCE